MMVCMNECKSIDSLIFFSPQTSGIHFRDISEMRDVQTRGPTDGQTKGQSLL